MVFVTVIFPCSLFTHGLFKVDNHIFGDKRGTAVIELGVASSIQEKNDDGEEEAADDEDGEGHARSS